MLHFNPIIVLFSSLSIVMVTCSVILNFNPIIVLFSSSIIINKNCLINSISILLQSYFHQSHEATFPIQSNFNPIIVLFSSYIVDFIRNRIKFQSYYSLIFIKTLNDAINSMNEFQSYYSLIFILNTFTNQENLVTFQSYYSLIFIDILELGLNYILIHFNPIIVLFSSMKYTKLEWIRRISILLQSYFHRGNNSEFRKILYFNPIIVLFSSYSLLVLLFVCLHFNPIIVLFSSIF